MITRKIRFIVQLMAIVGICLYFWTQSRYPDINRKAMMAKNASVADTISMYPILEVKSSDPMTTQIAYTTANWVYDNRKGMTFGVVIGALFLSIIGYLKLRPSENRFISTLYGFILGSPMGVCVNCAAPIFKGLLNSRQIEFSFAVMLSSPTMNIIALTMIFGLFPLYMAVTKVAFTLLVIFAGVPLISKILGPNHQIKDFQKLQASPKLDLTDAIEYQEDFFTGVKNAVVDFGKSFAFLAIRTVPLMFVAGFLGSVVSHLIPLDKLNGASGFMAILLTSLVGVLLPVPMAFDIVLTNALFVGGLSPSLALVLLCTLSIFSMYSFMITWNSASKQWALSLAGGIFALGVGVGSVGNWMDKVFYLEPNIRDYQAMTKEMQNGKIMMQGPRLGAEQGPSLPLSPSISPGPAPLLSSTVVYENDQITIKKTPFNPRAKTEGKFVKYEGADIGLTQGYIYRIRDYPDPFWVGRGTAGGDFNRDGWVDIAFGTDEGPVLYQNIGGKFAKVENFLPQMRDKRVYAVAFVDWNNDGWLDLFITTFNQGNYVAINHLGVFSDVIKIPNGNGILTISPAFADFDGDGFLDVYNGNMSLGIITGFRRYGKGRRNSLTFQRSQGTFEVKELDFNDGETMSTLASDFDGDGQVDIYTSNDFVVPDYLFLGRGSGTFVESTQAGYQFKTPFFSMSVDTGDFDNDLIMDFVSTGTTQVAKETGKKPIDGVEANVYSKRHETVDDCTKLIRQPLYQKNCRVNRESDHLIPFYKNKNLNISDCSALTDQVAKDECLLSVMWMLVTSNVNISNCQEQFGFDAKVQEVCEIFIKVGAFYDRSEFEGSHPQEDQAVVYLGRKEGGFSPMKIDHPGGWTWGTKAADFDNDGYLDIFNAEGAVRVGEYGFNVLLHNDQGQGFSQKQFSWNLTDPFNLFSFTVVDYNNDGALDIIGNSSIGPVQVYENRLNDNRSIAFLVRQKDRNTYGINARVTIKDAEGRSQMREIKAGGGFQSFDDPRVYFGLGPAKPGIGIEQVILRVDGRELIINYHLDADALYTLELKS